MMAWVSDLAVLAMASGWASSISASLSVLQETSGLAPLPASPPIGGVGWTVVVPAILFLGSFLGTYLLYRRFSKTDEEG